MFWQPKLSTWDRQNFRVAVWLIGTTRSTLGNMCNSIIIPSSQRERRVIIWLLKNAIELPDAQKKI